MDITIRNERPGDYRAVEVLTREAFWNHHSPGCDEHYLVHIMRDQPEFLPELAFVAERDDRIVGNIMYTAATITPHVGEAVPIISFGPISVLPELQKMGIGKALMQHSFQRAREMGYKAVAILGFPEVYRSSGFRPGKEFGIHTRWNTYMTSLMVRELMPGGLSGVSGAFREPDFFEMDRKAVEAFDREFPPKKKQSGFPSQLRFQELVNSGEPI